MHLNIVVSNIGPQPSKLKLLLAKMFATTASKIIAGVIVVGLLSGIGIFAATISSKQPAKLAENPAASDSAPQPRALVGQVLNIDPSKPLAGSDAQKKTANNTPIVSTNQSAPAADASGATNGSSSGGSSSGGGSSGGVTTCSGSQHTPGGPDGSGGCWPGANNTGVPAGTALTNYTGPCTITANNTVISAKTITCDLVIQAANVQVKNSRFVNGSIETDENSTGYSFTITDSEINIGNRAGTGLGAVNFTATRVHITGGNRSAHCWKNCTITDSYAHAQFTDPSGTFHESAFRMGADATFRHNSIACDAPDVPPDGGCSASLTGYGDFATVERNTIDHNLILATTGGFCAYGGSSGGKPYPNANNIRFTDNIFQRGTHLSDHGHYICGYYGYVTDFDASAPGNVWTNNRFDDGTAVTSSGSTI